MGNRRVEVYVGDGIYTGHRMICDEGNPKRTLHIWRNDHPQQSCHVSQGLEMKDGDMLLEYKDGEPIANADKTFDEIEAFFRIPGEVFVHCAVGQTRSPTIALIGKCVRGRGVYEAVSDILGSQHRARGIVWNMCLTPMQEILERYGG